MPSFPVHAGAARNRLSALPGAHAVDARGALQVDKNDPELATGSRTVPRGTTMHLAAAADDLAACEFRTAHDVTLWPIEVVSASYFSFAPDLPLNALPIAQRIKGGVRIRLRTTAGLKFEQTAIDRLPFYLTGRDDVANTLYELCLSSGLGTLVVPSKGARPWHEFLPAASIQPVGFSDAEALLPVTLRSFQGYRLLQEYFSFPQRFRFFEVTGLARGAEAGRGKRGRAGDPARPRRRDARERRRRVESRAVLHAGDQSVPEARRSHPRQRQRARVSRRAPTGPGRWTSRSTRSPSVVGHGIGSDSEQQFLPFYSAYSTDRGASALRLLHDAPRAAAGVGGGKAARAALELHRHRGVSVARRFRAGAVQRRLAPALDPDAVHESGSRAADADGHRHERPVAGHRRAGARASAS